MVIPANHCSATFFWQNWGLDTLILPKYCTQNTSCRIQTMKIPNCFEDVENKSSKFAGEKAQSYDLHHFRR